MTTLNQLPVGQTAVITKVGGQGALRCRLLDMGIIPHTAVTVVKIAPMGDPLELRIRGYELTLRIDDAKLIEIMKQGENVGVKDFEKETAKHLAAKRKAGKKK